MMKINRLNRNAVLVLMWCALIFPSVFAGSYSQAADESYLQQIEETLLVTGWLKDVSTEMGTFAVRPSKGKKIKLIFNDQTIFQDFVSLEDIEEKQRVNVWYFIDGEEKRALKIEKIPDLGC